MKIDVKKLLNFLFILGTFAVVLVIAFSNNELADAWETLFTLNFKWLGLAFLGWLVYVFFDSLSLHYFLIKQGYGIPLLYSIYISLIGFYYSDITPGAGGGQPMQVYYMSKKNVPVGVGSSVATIKVFSMQLMVVLTGLVLLIINREAMAAQLGGVKWLIIIGGIINFSAVPLILLVAFYRPPVQALLRFGVRIGAKIRLIKNPENVMLKADAMLDTYHASMKQVSKAPFQIVVQLILMGLSMFGLLSIPVSVYYAFGLSGTPWHHILTISYMVFWSASYTLLPGGSGMQEGGFLLYFQGIFTEGTIGLALLVWRFVSFYLFLLLGPLITLLWDVAARRKKKKDKLAKEKEKEQAKETEKVPEKMPEQMTEPEKRETEEQEERKEAEEGKEAE